MELILAATAIFTILQPFINAWINKINWTAKQKSYVAWGVAILIGAAYVYFTAGIGSWYQLFLAAPVIYGYGQVIFQFFVKNIATKFEAITTKGSAVVSPAETEGKADLVSDATIELRTGAVEIEAPVHVVPADPTPEKIVLEDDVKG